MESINCTHCAHLNSDEHWLDMKLREFINKWYERQDGLDDIECHHDWTNLKLTVLQYIRQSLIAEIKDKAPKDKTMLKLGNLNKRQEQATVGLNNCIAHYNESNAEWQNLLAELENKH